MGIYSDAFLLTGPQAEMEFNQRLGEDPDPVVNAEVLDFVHSALLIPKDGWTLRMWAGVKWYSNHGVDFIQKFMDDLCIREDDGPLPDGFRFVRVGETLTEEWADMETSEVLGEDVEPPESLYVVVRMVAKTCGPDEKFMGYHAKLAED